LARSDAVVKTNGRLEKIGPMSKVAGRGHPAATPPHALPHHLTAFVGREAELRSLKQLLRSSRMVTLTGTGGAGKSRLAAEVAKASGGEMWPDGVWWVELAAVTDVAGALVATLELPGRGPALQVAASWLAAKQALLILDNCEHIASACATTSQALLERCPRLTILATSRGPIGVAGEARWPVPSLPERDALRLFEARARLVRPGFEAERNAPTVVQICMRLDRLPLAIEMAAARLDMMSEKELLTNLNDRFSVLTSDARTAPERQQTMTATIDWSYRLLTEDEARLFRRLAVFQGGFTMEAVHAVYAEYGSAAALPLLSGLVQKSMVVADRSDDGTRYSLLESHHAFARERLRDAGELDAAQQRHYEHFSSRKWEPVESANFWHAVAWGRNHAGDGGLNLAIEIGDSDFSDQTRAGRLILDCLEHSKPSDTLRVKALTMAARLAWRQADNVASRALAESAVAAARKIGDSELLARALNGAGLVYETAGELVLAGQMYDEAIALLSDPKHIRLAIDFSNGRGLLALAQGDAARALEVLSRCVAFARSQGDPLHLARYLESLAQAQLDMGDVEQAAASWNESLVIFRVLSDWFGIIWSMVGLSLVASARREDERTLRLAAAADRLSREYSLTIWSFRALQLDGACRQARERLGAKGRGDKAWQEGQAMTTTEALEYALAGGRPAEQPLTDGGPLSRREREVVTMVAAGMTNRQIAERLFIAERTAEGHVERIRNKLGVRSRTEVATWAIAHGLRPLDNPPPGSKV
jgi:predicted ATPase/DNA-binding CsgD family transcriptional regulator